ncbi:hypothetical protein DXG01_013964 [Tephrocybe rancida]|nr:hypothetical protein DXG01_013964 [Tephrocybe rancida]
MPTLAGDGLNASELGGVLAIVDVGTDIDLDLDYLILCIVQIIQAGVALNCIAMYLGEDEVSSLKKDTSQTLSTAPSAADSAEEEEGLGIQNRSFKWYEVEMLKADSEGADKAKDRKTKPAAITVGGEAQELLGEGMSDAPLPEVDMDHRFELRDINMRFPEGELSVITGPTASEKTVLSGVARGALLVGMLDRWIDTQGTIKDLRAQGILEDLTHDSAKVPPEALVPTLSDSENADGEEARKVRQRTRKLVKDEHRQIGGVECAIYKSYLKVSSYWIWEVDPTSGHILIDGIDILIIGIHELRSRLTFIPQDATLFFGPLRENLDPFNEHADAECLDVLQRCHMISSPSASRSASLVTSPTGSRAASIHGRKREDTAESISTNASDAETKPTVSLKTSTIVLDKATSSIDCATDVKIRTTIWEEFNSSLLLTAADADLGL